jgi:hypothetical protein
MNEVLIFASRDSRTWATAQQLAAEAGVRLVDRLSSDLEDLLLLAEYGVVEPFVVIARCESGIVARVPRMVSATELAELMQLG